MKKKSIFTELQEDDMVRAAGALANDWENCEVLTEDKIQENLEALLSVMEGKIDYSEFKRITKVSDGFWLH